MANNYKNQLPKISTFIFDIDGVFTDGIVYLMNDGEQVRTANVKDGYALQYAVKMGYRVALISGGKNEVVRKRFQGLGVKDIFLASHNKVEVYEQYMKDHNLKSDEICYMGDDIPDLKVLSMVGLPCCPADAVPEVQNQSLYVSHKGGGKGCVRDILEQTMRVQGKWMTDEAHQW
ncbi:MAG: KdsC family phosphatase [Flavobacteriales bacterium]